MMPLLVILFVISYCILTMLVFEQGQTIESQRSLIREMLKDSTQLAALKDKQAARSGGERPEQSTRMRKALRRRGARGPAILLNHGQKRIEEGHKRPGKSAHEMKQAPESRPRIWKTCGAPRE